MRLAFPGGVLTPVRAAIALVVGLIPALGMAQPAGGDEELYSPITSSERMKWIAQGTVSLPAVSMGVFNSAMTTAGDWPKEWHQSPGGFVRRYADIQAAASLSNSIEAGLGMLWGEDPRHSRSGLNGKWARIRYAVATVALAPRRDGHLAPAWGRLAGNVFGNVIENSWLPPSVATRRATTFRVAEGFVGRLVSNIWCEFWPDLRQRIPSRRLRTLVSKED
jgi:hypothetical protein